jgi:hypothetical protein
MVVNNFWKADLILAVLDVGIAQKVLITRPWDVDVIREMFNIGSNLLLANFQYLRYGSSIVLNVLKVSCFAQYGNLCCCKDKVFFWRL